METVAQRVARGWGVPAQLDMMIEECGELIVAIHHLRRNKCDIDDVCEEIADVLFVAEQLSEVFAPAGIIQSIKQHKESRLIQRLEAAEGK